VRRIWNAAIDKRPALFARCTGTADVIAAVRFARQHELQIAVRSGGTTWPEARSATEGWLLTSS
jgi:FAD/FMN-containing dehydrogenase